MEDNYKPSKEFSDHAWTEMKALLDKEMPDKGAILLAPKQKKRNRFLLLLPLLLLLGMAGLFYYYQSDSDLSSSETTTKLKGASEFAIIPGNLTRTRENTVLLEEASNKVILENKESIESTNKTSVVDNAITHSSNKVASSKSYNEPQILNKNTENQIASSETQYKAPVINTPLEKEIKKVDEVKTSPPFISDSEKFYQPLEEVIEVDVKEEVREPIALVTPIDASLLNLLALDDENPDVEKFTNIRKPKNRLAIYGFVGIRNYDFSDNIDLATNVETVFRKGTKKLGLRTGINYAQRSTTYLTKEETIALVSSDIYEDAFNLGAGIENVVTDPNGYENYYEARAQLNSNATKYHFLEIPVFLDYKFSKKWSMHAGLSGKALIYSSSQDFGLLNGLGTRNQDSAFVLNESSTNNPEGDFSYSYFAPQKFNLGASLGVNFMATQRLGIQARFSQNLRDVYPELNGKQRSNSLELGVSWRLR